MFLVSDSATGSLLRHPDGGCAEGCNAYDLQGAWCCHKHGLCRDHNLAAGAQAGQAEEAEYGLLWSCKASIDTCKQQQSLIRICSMLYPYEHEHSTTQIVERNRD